MKIRNLDKLPPTSRRRRVLAGITAEKGNGKPLVLELVHAGDSNKGWRDASDKLDAQGAGIAGGEDWMRARLPAFARYVIVGWENAFDDDGKPEPYTAARGEKLLVDLFDGGGGDLVFLEMRYSFDPRNFRDMLDLDEGAAERLGNG